MPKNKPLLNALKHFLIGSALTMKGADKISHHAVIGSILLCMGLIILIYFFYLVIKKHPTQKLDLVAHWFEAFAALFTAYVFFTEGARFLPYAFLLAAAGFFFAIYMHHKKGHR